MAATVEDAPDATAPAVPHTKEKLEELASAAALQYTLKNFSKAADLYSSASEIQATLNGDLAPENAELLFFYGRALYKVAMQKSDVLGGQVAQREKKKSKAEKKAESTAESSSTAPANGSAKEETVETKPFFQIEGDENWTDSEDEDEGAEGGEEEEVDDFQNSYETFELARICYSKQLEALEDGDTTDKGKGKGKAEITPETRAIKAKLADCYGFLAEIGLENETFNGAVMDARSSLALAEELYPVEDEKISEAHYILSLALEMASNRKVREDLAGKETEASAGDADAQQAEETYIDYDLRNEAAEQTELAIRSVEARLAKEQTALTNPDISEDAKKEKEAIIENKKGALEDLKNRLADLRTDPKTLPVDSIDSSVLQGLLGGMLGANPAEQKAKLEAATKSANDITGLVKSKKKDKVAAASSDAGGSKRKLDADDETADGKRAKTEDLAE